RFVFPARIEQIFEGLRRLVAGNHARVVKEHARRGINTVDETFLVGKAVAQRGAKRRAVADHCASFGHDADIAAPRVDDIRAAFWSDARSAVAPTVVRRRRAESEFSRRDIYFRTL